jgi:hypothetical protein
MRDKATDYALSLSSIKCDGLIFRDLCAVRNKVGADEKLQFYASSVCMTKCLWVYPRWYVTARGCMCITVK